MEKEKNETSEERFKRLASSRTDKTLRSLRILANLSNRHRYKYTEEEIRKIFSAIDQQLRETKTKFRSSENREFKL